MSDKRMAVDFGVWGTVRSVAVGVVVLTIMGAMGVFCIPVLREGSKLRHDIEIKRTALKKQQELHERYNREITDLKTDPEAVIRALREKSKYVKPGEDIYHFDEPEPSGSVPRNTRGPANN